MPATMTPVARTGPETPPQDLRTGGRSELANAMGQLAQDAATAQAISALEAREIRVILIKGAAIAARLYDAPAQRAYADGDLLVDPARFADAAGVLEQLGYAGILAGAREPAARHARAFRRAHAMIDLHHQLYLSRGDPARAWAALSADTESLHVGGREVEVLGDPALALVLTAHVVQHGTMATPLEDLRQALQRFDRGVWHRARELAGELMMDEVLGAGLRELGAGRQLARELGLPTNTSAEIRSRLAGRPPLTDGFQRISEAGSPTAVLRLIAGELAPSPGFMHIWWPPARRGRLALALAYAYRPLWLLCHAPTAYLHWRAANGRRPHRDG